MLFSLKQEAPASIGGGTFTNYYWIAADVGEMYRAGYANRAEATYQYVAGIDLTTPYGVPAYGFAGNGR